MLHGRDMSVREVFDYVDEDNSGHLDKAEMERAAGLLGGCLGFVLSGEELNRQFDWMDHDGDGTVDFQEFSRFWKGMEAEQLCGDMDEDDLLEALAEAGIVARPGASVQAMRETIKAHYTFEDVLDWPVEEVFKLVDADGEGHLTETNVQHAAGLFGARAFATPLAKSVALLCRIAFLGVTRMAFATV
jgi:hypothetical protein